MEMYKGYLRLPMVLMDLREDGLVGLLALHKERKINNGFNRTVHLD